MNRHDFIQFNGKRANDPSSCYFQHVASGKLYSISNKVVFPDFEPQLINTARFSDRDIALARLNDNVESSVPIKMSELLINAKGFKGQNLAVVSNGSENANDGNETAKTIALCEVVDPTPTTVMQTTCPTGMGSSGSQVYATDSGTPHRLIGLVSGEKKRNPEGSGYDPHSLATLITFFDDSLPDLYNKLKAMDTQLK